MILDFPHKSVLQLVLQGDIVPLEIMTQPARFSSGEDGHVFLEFDQKLPQKAIEKLNLLGIYRSSRHPTEQIFSAHCWYQAIPLEKDTNPIGEDTERIGNVIFKINNEENLRVVVEEILRLGNDRMALLCYRQVNSNELFALLHVNCPPYYTVLKALEPDIGSQQKTIFAYYEQTPRCWVELGWKYPLAHLISVPENRRLFICAPHHWEFFDDAPFQNIYQSLDIQIPAVHCLWQAQDQVSKIPIPLRLIPGDPHRAEPTLWLIPEQRQLDFEEWLRGANENILRRLSFAVAEIPDGKDEKWIVLYAETYEQALSPPILNLDMAFPYVPHPLVRNIYLPRGSTLHPPVRAETLQRLLLGDSDRIVWLYPKDNHAFQPCALSLSAFRSLSEWIDYLIAQHHAVLKEWVDATVFDWPSDTQRVVMTSEPDDGGSPPAALSSSASSNEATRQVGQQNKVTTSDDQRKTSTSSSKRGKTPTVPKTGAQQPADIALPHNSSFRELEQRFLQVPGSRLDDPERIRLWPELAHAYIQAGDLDQSTLCWLHALWHCEPANMLPLVEGWFQSEWYGQTIPSVRQWKQVLDSRLSTRSVVQRLLASFMYWTLQYPEHCTADYLQVFQRFLVENRDLIPLRGQWLAYRLISQKLNDSLLLSRCADHILEKLYHDPSVALGDLPRFLYDGSLQYQQLLQRFKDKLNDILNEIIQWINVSYSNSNKCTPYTYYLFAYLAARLQITSKCIEWVEEANEIMKKLFMNRESIGSDVGKLYVSIVDKSYKHRINEAIQKLPPSPKLPSDIHQMIGELRSICEQQPTEMVTSRMAYYVINRLLQKSELLEPLVQEDAITVYLGETHDDSSMMGYLYSLRQTLVQIFSAKSLDLWKLWSVFIDKFRKLFDSFPVSEKTMNYRREISELGCIYARAFYCAGLYSQQRWIDDLLETLLRHVDVLRRCDEDGVPLALVLLSELVPVSLHLERICHNSDVLMYIRKELQPWSYLHDENLKTHRLTEALIQVRISASVACMSADVQRREKELEILHQYIMTLEPGVQGNIEKNSYVRVVVNYIKSICCLGDKSAIDYIHRYFKDCIRGNIRIQDSFSSDEYLSLDCIQITESIKYVLDTIVGGNSIFANNRGMLVTDWQIENEYLLRRRIINDIKEVSATVAQ
jgi:hypothetical protein